MNMTKWYTSLLKSENKCVFIDSTLMELKTSYLKKLLDFLFRKALFKKHSSIFKNGKFKCMLTGNSHKIENAQVCHYISRKYLATRWDFDNCVVCSKQSNYWDNQNMLVTGKSLHISDFEKLLGDKLCLELKNKSNILKTVSRYDYINKIKEVVGHL